MTDNKSLEEIHADFRFRLMDRIKRIRPVIYRKSNGEFDTAVIDNISASRTADEIELLIFAERTKDIQKISFHSGIPVEDIEGWLRSRDE